MMSADVLGYFGLDPPCCIELFRDIGLFRARPTLLYNAKETGSAPSPATRRRGAGAVGKRHDPLR